MKALILNSTGKGDEAFALAKAAIVQDMKSHVCWHVMGLLHRSTKNYAEAIKAYKFALKFEPEQANILRDLALLQIQLRDYAGYLDSRRKMLTQRPQSRQNWTAVAIAYHLMGNYEAAEKTLTTFEGTLTTPPSKGDLEHSEAVLYKNTIIAESGDIARALEHLDSILKITLDRTSGLELRASYLLQLGKMEEAEKAYRALLERNNEHRAYYEGLEKALGLDRSDSASQEKLKELYDSYAAKSDRLDAARRIPLDFLNGGWPQDLPAFYTDGSQATRSGPQPISTSAACSTRVCPRPTQISSLCTPMLIKRRPSRSWSWDMPPKRRRTVQQRARPMVKYRIASRKRFFTS